MVTTNVNSESFEQLSRDLPDGKPFYMINLLRFRDIAVYADGVTPAGKTGQEAYFNGYLPAFGAVAKELGLESVHPIFAGMVAGIVAGPSDETWDATAIVAYPDFAAFRRISESDGYIQTADPHRRAALADWRLIAATKLETPG
jgi:hypothetical protein